MQSFRLSPQSKIYVAGHGGLVGSALVRALNRAGYQNLVLRSSKELDLRNQSAVEKFFEIEAPEIVLLAAAKVGGIGANSKFPVEFLLENLQIQTNVISSSAVHGVKKLVFLGSSCIYPKTARHPLTEDQILTGPFESTNEAYGLAKVTGIKLCEYYARQYGKNFISVQPTNLYGPNDSYDTELSHVIPAMILKVLKAKQTGASFVEFWGSGTPKREFLHCDDLANAILVCIEKYNSPELINIGSGEEVQVSELAQLICKNLNFRGEIRWNKEMPDGVMRKSMDSTKIRGMGWAPAIKLADGLRQVLSEKERSS